MELERTPAGDILLRDLHQVFVDILIMLPAVLESDDPRVRDRLLPRAYEDDEEEEEWRRIGAPELEHLFASRVRLIRKDLKTLAPEQGDVYRLDIPRIHENAWLSGLNAARHTFFILNELEPGDVERDPEDLKDPEKAMALLHIHLMGWMQELIMKAG